MRAARVLDVRSGAMAAAAVVVVDGERIVSTGTDIPANARVIDLGDVTLLPGLFDMHAHIDIGGTQALRPSRAMNWSALDAAYQAAVNAEATLLAGFTSIRSAGSNDRIDVALKRAIERGAAIGPRITPAGYQISMTGGHGDNVGFPEGVYELGPKQGVADGVDQLLFAVRYQIKHGSEVIKLTATAGVLSEEASAHARQFSDEELQAVVDEAKRHGLRVLAHAHGAEGIIAAVKAGVASIEHGSMLDAEGIRQMKERGTYLVPTLYVAQPASGTRDGKSEHIVAKGEAMSAAIHTSFRNALAAGVKIAFGTDSGVYPHGLNAREFAVLVQFGMKPLDAIRTATINAAGLLGADDRGTLERGKLADIIAVPGNPLEDITSLERVVFVMKGGAIFRNAAPTSPQPPPPAPAPRP